MSSSGEKSGNLLSQLDKKEIDSLLRNGAYELFDEKADQASKRSAPVVVLSPALVTDWGLWLRL